MLAKMIVSIHSKKIRERDRWCGIKEIKIQLQGGKSLAIKINLISN